MLFYLHHPAHFHLFKNVIKSLKQKNEITILATKKDILEELLQKDDLKYINVLPKGRKDNKFSIALGVLKQDLRLLKICLKIKPDILVGTSTEITHIGKLINIPSIFVNEDDIYVIPLVGSIAFPFVKVLLVPNLCSTGKWEHKSVKYNGYHELTYLHPKYFNPNEKIVEKYFSADEPYFILRLAQLTAHHDKGITGIDSKIVSKLITLLKQHGNIYITSERELEPEFEQYRLNIDPIDIHHVMAFAKMYIGDSQTMAAEAAVLGTPAIRFNDFVGKLGYLEELEHKYGLTYGIKTSEPEKLFQKISELLTKSNLKEEWQQRRQKMLQDKIDVTAFMVWFIENYPRSVKIIKDNPEYPYNFK